MDVFEISARAACKRNNLDPEEWWEFIGDKVDGTNAAYGTMSGGVNRSNVADYSQAVATSIGRLVAAGTPREDIRSMAFMDLYNWQDDPRPGWPYDGSSIPENLAAPFAKDR